MIDLLAKIKARDSVKGRWGIGTAGVYLRQLLTPGFSAPDNWDAMLKRADSQLVYCHPAMIVEKEAGGKFDPTPGAILEFNGIVTTKAMDRDGDVMHPDGAQLDPACALLWQHMPDQPIGKLVKQLSQNDQSLRARFAIADTQLGRDAATLVEFGALRISHGFLPLKFTERRSKDAGGVEWSGWDISKYEVMEVSLVAVPSNRDAVITAFSRQKLADPMVKSWAKGLFDSRPTLFKGADMTNVDAGDPTKVTDDAAETTPVTPATNDDANEPPADAATQKSTGNYLIDRLMVVKAKKAEKPDDEDATDGGKDEAAEGETDEGISESAVAKVAAGLKGCGHFGQAFVHHGQKSVHHTLCSKCGPGCDSKAKKPETPKDGKVDEGDVADDYDDADAIRESYMKCAGVKHVTVAHEYHPPMNKGWAQVHPISRAWVDSVNREGEGNQQQPPNQNANANQNQNGNGQPIKWQNGNKGFATPGKKFYGAQIDGSWEQIRNRLATTALEYLQANGFELAMAADADDDMAKCCCVNVSAMFDTYAVVEVWCGAVCPNDPQLVYTIGWARGANGPVWVGQPRRSRVQTTVAITDEDADTLKAHRAIVRPTEKFAAVECMWQADGIKAIGGKLKGDNGPMEVQRIVFDQKQWSAREVKHWLKHNGYKAAALEPAAPGMSERLRGVLSMLRAQNWLYHTSHWQASGDDAYQTHLLFERLYTAIPEQYDALAEKMVAMFGEDAVDAVPVMQEALKHLERWRSGNPFESAKMAEEELQSAVKSVLGASEEMPGLENTLQTIAGEHDTFAYLVGQQLKGGHAAVVKEIGRLRVKAGRVLSGANEAHVKEAMSCHQEILKLGPEHASKVCKALVKEAHGHLDSIVSASTPGSEPLQTKLNGNAMGVVRAYLAITATDAELKEAGTIIRAREVQTVRDGSRSLLARLGFGR